MLCCAVDILLHILTKVDVAETAASDLAANTILVPHAEVLQTVSDVVLGSVGVRQRGARGVQSRGGRWEEHAPWWSCLRLTSRDEDLGSGDEVVVVFSPTVCSVVVLRLWGSPAGVCGNAWVVGGGRVVVRRWWWWVVLVLVSRREREIGGGRWWRVLASGGSQRETEAAGFGRRLAAGGSNGAETGQRARQEQASQQASKAVCQGERQRASKVAVKGPRTGQTPANNRSQRQRRWGKRRLVCVCE